MHPAYSVILFTTASGAGYGLLILLAVFALLGLVPLTRGFGVIGIGGALALVCLGLLSSVAHLGRPTRSWRAFSQWRSSWLSREGIAAVASVFPAALFGIGWSVFGSVSGIFAVAASATIVLAVVTLWCTGMIYASLPTIRAWHHPLVTPIYLVLAIATGGVLQHLLLTAFGLSSTASAIVALLALGAAGWMKLRYWSAIDRSSKTYTVESATGLGRFGKVRTLEPPHTQANFVMREMGYRIGRKHAQKLRRLAIVLLVLIPASCLLAALFFENSAAILLGTIAAIAAAAGVLIERWLFFAEAEHVVMIYYGADNA